MPKAKGLKKSMPANTVREMKRNELVDAQKRLHALTVGAGTNPVKRGKQIVEHMKGIVKSSSPGPHGMKKNEGSLNIEFYRQETL